jgi:L-ribulokinase
MSRRYPAGVDCGTLSGRAVVVRVAGGAELGSAMRQYARGVMERVPTAGRPGFEGGAS